MANYKHRVHTTNRYAATNAGFFNDAVHVSGQRDNWPVTPSAGYVLVTMIVNTAPATGVILLKIGQDILAIISSSASATFEHKYNCYLYDQLYISVPDSSADITLVVSKGFAGTA